MNTALCILCTLLLGLIFRSASHYKLPMFPIVVINYLVCSAVGMMHEPLLWSELRNQAWFFHSLILGILFFTGFSLFAKAVQYAGLPISVLFQKLSIVLTVPFAVMLGDSLHLMQYFGIFLACIAIFFLNNEPGLVRKGEIKVTYYLLACLFVSAAIECTFISARKLMHWTTKVSLEFINIIFMCAFITGTFYIILSKPENTKRINWKVIGMGILLGFPNYYSIYFMMKALHSEFIPSLFYTLLNSFVIILSCLTGYFLFRDRLTNQQMIGLVVSLISISILTLANNS